MDREMQPDRQVPAKISLRGITEGRIGGYDIPRSSSTLPFIGRHQQFQDSLHESTLRSTSKRRFDSVGISTQRAEPLEPKSRRDGTRHTQHRLPESDARGEMQAMRAELSRLEQENRAYRTQVATLQSQQIPIHSQTADIPLSSFGITANLTSTGDVRRMMEDLEAEIFQTAAALSEFDFRGQSARSRLQESRGQDSELHNRLVPVLGGELVGLLSRGRAHPMPAILVQIALQSVMSAWSSTNICAWILNRGGDQLTGFLADLYAEICRAEDSRDAARWRTMTRKQLVKRASAADIGATLLQHIVDVIILSRSENEEPLSRKAIEAAFGDRVEAVLRLVLDLNRDMGTRIVSDELETVFVDPGTRFDSRTMENEWPKDVGRLSGSELVVCTTGLGLRKRVQNGAVLFMKPKVLLRSTLGQLAT
ncbi:NmrA domain-containing protein [Mycena venus]|uniref:NmrA domain-containing protein n=1 Tax=Mycena venus TaxID=2733690 RepID=A0A8H6YMN3_9AGAR|nr:NmrA domain-containing protein [Mycena venus]